MFTRLTMSHLLLHVQEGMLPLTCNQVDTAGSPKLKFCTRLFPREYLLGSQSWHCSSCTASTSTIPVHISFMFYFENIMSVQNHRKTQTTKNPIQLQYCQLQEIQETKSQLFLLKNGKWKINSSTPVFSKIPHRLPLYSLLQKIEAISTSPLQNSFSLLVSTHIYQSESRWDNHQQQRSRQQQSTQQMQNQKEPPCILYETKTTFYLQCNYSHLQSSSTQTYQSRKPSQYLMISRITNKIQTIAQESFRKEQEDLQLKIIAKFYMLMGTIIINHEPYLMVVSEAEEVATYIHHEVYMVTDVMFVNYRKVLKYQKQQECEECEKIIQTLRKNYISEYFYFSLLQPITLSLSGRDQTSQVFNQFAWNKKLLQPFIKSKVERCWTIPVIQGFVAEIKVKNKYYKWQYVNVSRRSVYQSGTRFNSRGIDANGHPANFVESQEIIKCHNRLFVHVSVRGSVPIFWQQQKVRSGIQFQKESASDEQGLFRKHYMCLQHKYQGQVVTINLLSKDKSPEATLRKKFQAMYGRSMGEEGYLFFDLNKVMEDKEDGQYLISQFVKKNHEAIFGTYPFSIYQHQTQQQLQKQSIVPRVNCLDCLDRTNVMTARISELFMIAVSDYLNEEATIFQKRLDIDKVVVNKLVDLWAVLGDKISKIYCGTSSVATHMTKKENNSILSALGGAFTSINRYIHASTSDQFKQECIDTLLGNRGELSKTEYFTQNLLREIGGQEEYCSYSEIKVSVLTFDSDHISQIGENKTQFQQLLKDVGNGEYDLVVLCWQQVESVEKWSFNLQRTVVRKGYKLLMQVENEKVGLMTMMFHKRAGQHVQLQYLTKIDIPLKSHGALATFIQANNSILCFINCRFPGGYNHQTIRYEQFNQLHQYMKRQTYASHLLMRTQATFLAGNMNLRLSQDIQKQFQFKNQIQEVYAAEISGRIDGDMIRGMMKHDQARGLIFSRYFQYQEGEIMFLPTYCFSGKRGGFDRSKPPAWCDRIFFSQPAHPHSKLPPIKVVLYRRVNERFQSSHKAVVGLFLISVKKEKEEVRNKIISSYLYKSNSFS